MAGFSQGGYVALSAVAEEPGRYAGAIAIGSAADAAIRWPTTGETGGPRVYLGVGSEDPVADACRATARRLREVGVAHRLRVYRNVGHSFPPNYRTEFRRVLRFVLGSQHGE